MYRAFFRCPFPTALKAQSNPTWVSSAAAAVSALMKNRQAEEKDEEAATTRFNQQEMRSVTKNIRQQADKAPYKRAA